MQAIVPIIVVQSEKSEEPAQQAHKLGPQKAPLRFAFCVRSCSSLEARKNMVPEDLIEKKLAEANSLEEIAEVLKLLLGGGFSVWEDGSLYFIRQLVARVNGLRIEVFAKEHAPPHFHVHGGGVNATFSLENCEHLQGNVGRREKALIEWWYERSREQLIQAWNSSRPSDCPVGAYTE